MLLRLLDAIGNLFGAKVRFKDPLLKPLSPNELKVFRDKVGEEKKAIVAEDLPHSGVPSNKQIAERLHSLRPSVSVQQFEDQIRSPIASRMLAIWVEIHVPALKKTIILDTRTDNPEGLPPSIAEINQDSPYYPWPEPAAALRKYEATMKGHGGSSCPGYLSHNAHIIYPIDDDDFNPRDIPGLGGPGTPPGGGFPSGPDGNPIRVPGGVPSVASGMKANDWLEIPVEVLAFHLEGENDECAYSVAMFSEVFGKLTTTLADDKAKLNMWGKMMITLRPHEPKDYANQDVIQLVSAEYVRQTGTITGFPPHNPGEYIESSGNELYVGINPGQRHIEAIVKRGRIIFSTDVDDFLQARTRVTHFAIVDKDGYVLDPGSEPPYTPAILDKIAGVKMYWHDVRNEHTDVSHYLVYRVNMDSPKDFIFIGRSHIPMFYDSEYTGREPLAYAIVPALRDNVGMEVQGVSLDLAGVAPVEPLVSQFTKRNHGVGHVRTV